MTSYFVEPRGRTRASVIAFLAILGCARDPADPLPERRTDPSLSAVMTTATAPCTRCTWYGGTLTATGDAEIEPDGGFFDESKSGVHTGWLRGPSGTDLALVLQKWNPSTHVWTRMKRVDVVGSPNETLTYNGAPGRYRWRIISTSGSGAYDFWMQAPSTQAQPPTSGQYRAVSAGGQNACAITPGDAIYCWGHGGFGTLGNGTAVAWADKPVQVNGGPWDSVSVGHYTACALQNGAAWCWGADTWGALGQGFVSWGCNNTSPSNAGCSLVPLRVVGNHTFTRISTGGQGDRSAGPPFSRFSFGLKANGQAWGWGSDSDGELGDGTQYPNENPTPILVSGGIVWRQVVAGRNHACGIDVNGIAYCWGSELWGEIGDDNPPPQQAFTQYGAVTPPARVLGGLTFQDIDPAQVHTCGVATGGKVYCWGFNGFGNLGTPNVPDCSSDPRYPMPCSPVPVPIASNLAFTKVTTGISHSCALTTTGDIWCWGSAVNVGAGSPTSIPSRQPCFSNPQALCVPTPVKTSTSVKFVQVDAGMNFTCALSTTGKVYCWGSDFYGLAKQGSAHFVPMQINNP
jgi:alpha-tubulin suppressor-like RCC1 family protein